MISGSATAEGTARYGQRFPQLSKAGHFRRPEGARGVSDLWLPSLGLGTYLGDPTDSGDRGYTAAITQALRSGINLLDTAINYRHQRSERNIGAAVQQLVSTGELQREEVLVCTKAGYLSFDGAMPADPRSYFLKEYVEPGVVDGREVAAGSHCMAPRYLENQLERSRRNLGLETIDVFYVHNPESQLGEVPRPLFRERLKNAFATLEGAVEAGKIRWYGVATWNAFRVVDEHMGMDLGETVGLAQEAGGEHHHFRFVQLPFNLAMPEAFALKNQRVDGRPTSLLQAAAHLGVAVVGSATLYQGQLADGLPPFIQARLGLGSDAHNAIQFARSAPGLLTSLIGMGRREHVDSNLQVAAHPPTPRQEWEALFVREA